jgi:hypothetical protein
MKAAINGKKHSGIVHEIRSAVMDGNTNMKEAIALVRGLKRAPTGNFYTIEMDEMIRLIGYLADGVASLSSAQELAMKAQDLIANNVNG